MLVTGHGDDRFTAGTWQLDAWLESDLGSAKGDPGSHMKDKVRLTKEAASHPPVAVFFSHFYHGVRGAQVKFENGRVEGQFAQGRVDDIAAHTVPIAGTYASDRFSVTFEYAVFGMTMRQMVEGRLIEPLG